MIRIPIIAKMHVEIRILFIYIKRIITLCIWFWFLWGIRIFNENSASESAHPRVRLRGLLSQILLYAGHRGVKTPLWKETTEPEPKNVARLWSINKRQSNKFLIYGWTFQSLMKSAHALKKHHLLKILAPRCPGPAHCGVRIISQYKYLTILENILNYQRPRWDIEGWQKMLVTNFAPHSPSEETTR